MHRFCSPTCLALIMLTLPWQSLPACAQQQAPDLVPFKATFVAHPQPTVVPTDPVLVTQPTTLAGQSDLWGAFTGTVLTTVHRGLDGKPLFATVMGNWTMANGDALSVEITLLYPPQAASGGPQFEGALAVVNGNGRFLGARGSGFLTGSSQTDPTSGQVSVSVTVEGNLTTPKS